MTNWLFFSLASFGLAFVFGYSHITLPLRERLSPGWVLTFLECPACVGWHLGWSAWWFGLVAVPWGPSWLAALSCAFIACAVNLLLARLSGLSHG